jgi:hypothetical protein
MKEQIKTIDSNTLAQVLNYTSELYKYAKKKVKSDRPGNYKVLSDNRWLEVACNVFSLMQTEFPPNAPDNNPYRDLPSLGVLKDALNSVQDKALERCREQYQHVEMPETNLSRTF